MVERDKLSDRAYAFLRDAIISGDLADGSQHSIYRLAEELGMSRTPVREAVLQLSEAGLVTVERNRGIRVRGMTVEKLRDIFELRLLLEVPASFAAATRRTAEVRPQLEADIAAQATALAQGDEHTYRLHDRAFHDHIALLAGNRQLCAALDDLRDITWGPGSWSNYGGRDPQEVIDEHAVIAAAIGEGDARESVRAMREHLVRTGTILLEHLAERMGETAQPNWAERLAIPFAC